MVVSSRNDASFAVALNCGIASRSLESARESVGQAPQGLRGKLLDPRVEILVVNAPGQMFRGVELAPYECPADNHFLYTGDIWQVPTYEFDASYPILSILFILSYIYGRDCKHSAYREIKPRKRQKRHTGIFVAIFRPRGSQILKNSSEAAGPLAAAWPAQLRSLRARCQHSCQVRRRRNTQ